MLFTTSSVNSDEKEQSDNINEMSISRSGFETKVLFRSKASRTKIICKRIIVFYDVRNYLSYKVADSAKQ
jgi:hypothetical protein